MGVGPFRYIDRWQTSLANLWGRDDHRDELLRLLEDRDRDLENWLTPHMSGTYTPALTGMAVGTGGNAANTATYTAIPCGTYWNLHIEGTITFGTAGTTFPTTPTASIPSGFNISAGNNRIWLGWCALSDISGNNYKGTCNRASATAIEFAPELASGTYAEYVAMATTVPFTWANGDSILWVVDANVVLV